MDESHPAYWLHGTDNAIIVRSAFHPSPLVIQGAGEGAKVAASSILNDILK
jgi:homoserine dehydrogenase